MKTTRRQFVQTGLGSAAGLSLCPSLSFAANAPGPIPIGFQLYTVRGAFARNVPETLYRLGRLGYKAVEFWGYGGTPEVYQKFSAKELRKLLDENGLNCCGMHMELKALARENFERTVENNKILGNEYLNVAMAPDKMSTAKGIAELGHLLDEAASQARRHHMQVGYHSHGFDFAKINGRFAWEILFSNTRHEVNMQLDVGNSLDGHGDPIAMLKKFPGRTPTIHIKEHGDKTFESDFYKEVFHLCETTSKTKWYIVEMGDAEGTGFDIPRDALAKLHRLGK